MKLFRFDQDIGAAIDKFDSVGFIFSRLAWPSGDVRIACAHLQAGGVIGHHQAVGSQLFVVVQGQGTVRGAEDVVVPIAAGQAAFWVAGEWHETRTETGLTAILVECETMRREDIGAPELVV